MTLTPFDHPGSILVSSCGRNPEPECRMAQWFGQLGFVLDRGPVVKNVGDEPAGLPASPLPIRSQQLRWVVSATVRGPGAGIHASLDRRHAWRADGRRWKPTLWVRFVRAVAGTASVEERCTDKLKPHLAVATRYDKREYTCQSPWVSRPSASGSSTRSHDGTSAMYGPSSEVACLACPWRRRQLTRLTSQNVVYATAVGATTEPSCAA
jgi:hypothetical protein